MKRIITMFALLLCSITATHAKAFDFGFAAGTSLSDYKIDGLSTDSKTGMYGQLDMNIKVLFLNISPEVTYRFNQFGVTSPSSYTVQNHSIDGTIMAGLTILKILTLEAGPRYTYDITSRKVYSDGNKEKIGSINPDWGYSAGVGLNLWKLNLALRYNGQFKSNSSSLGSNTRTSSYTLGLGFKM